MSDKNSEKFHIIEEVIIKRIANGHWLVVGVGDEALASKKKIHTPWDLGSFRSAVKVRTNAEREKLLIPNIPEEGIPGIKGGKRIE